MVIQLWCQETKVLIFPSPQVLPNIIHDVIATCTIHFSIDWKVFADERIMLETGSTSDEMRCIM